jgi:tripartite-type tricarboxylate transporter receptor subunit TctC
MVLFLLVFLIMLTWWEGIAQSQEMYPTKPIEIIVPYSPGGATDLLNRIIATALNKKWSVPVNVINKPGGNTVPGQMQVYNANPDGYTVLGDANSTSSFIGIGAKDLPFKVLDRTFISMLVTAPHFFVVGSKSPFNSFKEVVAEAKRDPANFSWTMSGSNDSVGYTIRQFFREINVDILKTKAISTSGSAQQVALLAGGNALLGCPTAGGAIPSIRSGLLKPLAVTSKTRHPDWPDVPSTAELGYPKINGLWWAGMSAPPKLSAAIVTKWENELAEILKDPEVISKIRNLGQTIHLLNSKATREFVIWEMEDAQKIWVQ